MVTKINQPAWNNLAFLRRVLSIFALTVLAVTLAGEFVARSPLGAGLPAPSLNAESFLLDKKIYGLESQIRRDGRVDCLFVGSSVTNTDIDPAIIERIYREQTGQSIHCYNLGIPLMSGHNTAAFSRALIQRFHPKVIFYILLARDVSAGESNADAIERSAWMQENLGKRSLQGWALNNSYTFRYYLTWRYWLNIQNRGPMLNPLSEVTAKGFEPRFGFNTPYPSAPPTTTSELGQVWSDDDSLQNAAAFLGLQNKNVRVVLIEGPQYRDPSADLARDPYWRAYETGYFLPLEKIAVLKNTPFWRTDKISLLIPKSNWYDFIHLNESGAITFSEWLGAQIAQNAWLFK